MNRFVKAVEQAKKALLDSFEFTALVDEAIDKYDLVEVVHCRECKWYATYTMENKTYKMCRKAHLGSDDFFCADGQKMDGKEKNDEE